MENIISVKDMTFEYVTVDSRFKAIDDLSLEVKQGEFVAIIGHNGSGKSTLSKNLNAILVPSQGDIYIDGMNTKDESKLWDIRQTAGMVFQNPDNQIVATIVEEDVAFGPENLGVEPKLIRKYNLTISVRNNIIYDNGKQLLEVGSLVSSDKVAKG